MRKTICLFWVIIIHLCDNTGTLSVESEHSYTVRGVKYAVEEVFAENGVQLAQRFMNLLETTDGILPVPEAGVTINTEYVSAVGKDENEKDSK